LVSSNPSATFDPTNTLLVGVPLKEADTCRDLKRPEDAAALRLWAGDPENAYGELIQSNAMNSFFVALCPAFGKNVWEEMLSGFASDLVKSGSHDKAVLCLLSLGKVREAIGVYSRAKKFLEASVLARARLPPSDPQVIEIYSRWAQNYLSMGDYERVFIFFFLF